MFYPLINSELLHSLPIIKQRCEVDVKSITLTTPSTKPDTVLNIKLYQVTQ